MKAFLDFTRDQATISHHLKVMRDAGMVGYRRYKQFHCYFCACPELVTRLLEIDEETTHS